MQVFHKKTLWLVLLNSLLLTACNDMQQSKSAIQKTEQFTATSIVLTGKVVNDSHEVKAFDDANKLVASVAIDNGRYTIEIPAQTKLPIVLQAGELI